MDHELESDECERDVSDNQDWEDDGASWIKRQETNTNKEVDTNYRACTPQRMDTPEIQALRAALNRREMQLRQEGRMQEYVARKPVSSSKFRQWYGLPRDRGSISRPIVSAGPPKRLEKSGLSSRMSPSRDPRTSTRSMPAGVKTAEFARILKQEARQVRELERRYQDSKRSLLDYIEVVTSCKPNDRVGGQEIYEQLADLISFAARCSISE